MGACFAQKSDSTIDRPVTNQYWHFIIGYFVLLLQDSQSRKLISVQVFNKGVQGRFFRKLDKRTLQSGHIIKGGRGRG